MVLAAPLPLLGRIRLLSFFFFFPPSPFRDKCASLVSPLSGVPFVAAGLPLSWSSMAFFFRLQRAIGASFPAAAHEISVLFFPQTANVTPGASIHNPSPFCAENYVKSKNPNVWSFSPRPDKNIPSPPLSQNEASF